MDNLFCFVRCSRKLFASFLLMVCPKYVHVLLSLYACSVTLCPSFLPSGMSDIGTCFYLYFCSRVVLQMGLVAVANHKFYAKIPIVWWDWDIKRKVIHI